MNTGGKISLFYFDAQKSIKRGDLFRVIEVTERNKVTLAAIDDACLRDDEIGARTKERKKPKEPKEPKKRPQSPKQERQNEKARVAWKKRSVLQCLAIIDKENEG